MIRRHQKKTTAQPRKVSRAKPSVRHVIQIRRVYDDAQPGEGKRFLVDRLWPRGISKKDLGFVEWPKDVAPSGELRKWFGHQPENWNEFQKRYLSELKKNATAWKPLLEAFKESDITLLFAAHDPEKNQAVVLKKFLEQKMRSSNR